MALLRALTSMAHTPRTTVGCLSEGDKGAGEPGRRSLSRSKLMNLEDEGDLGGGIAIVGDLIFSAHLDERCIHK